MRVCLVARTKLRDSHERPTTTSRPYNYNLTGCKLADLEVGVVGVARSLVKMRLMATTAASFVREDRSAPTKPGVFLAIC